MFGLLSTSPIGTQIVTESVTLLNKNHDNLKIRFKAVLQSFDKLNRNGRIYPKHKMVKAVEELKYFVQNRELLGEFGHPENVVTPERLFVIHPQHISHIIRNIWMEGDLVVGEIETTGPWGPHLAKLILDKANVGFSGRIYVSKWDRDYKTGAIRVADDADVRIITYDAVIIPSHKEAYIREETVTTVTESTILDLTKNVRKYCTQYGCYVTAEQTIVPPTVETLMFGVPSFELVKFKVSAV